MIREAIKSAMKKKGLSAKDLHDNSGVRYPSLTKFLNQSGNLSIDNLDIVFQTLGLSIQERWQNKTEMNPQEPNTGTDGA